MTFDPHSFRDQIPYYLTADPAKKAFLSELKSLSEGAQRGYILSQAHEKYISEMLQGDGWSGFQVFSFMSRMLNYTRGIVLSNSCDISPDNRRAFPQKIVFAPLVKLSSIESRFRNSSLDAEQIKTKLAAIRMQSVTNIFYLPSDSHVDEEYVALLDDLHSMPAEEHKKKAEKLFTLSMAGFYMFLFKLSIHFCRLQENVDRRDVIPPQ